MLKTKAVNVRRLFWSTDFNKDPEVEEQQKKKGAKFKPIKVLKRLSHKGDAGKSPRKDKTPWEGRVHLQEDQDQQDKGN